jgi:hypothetical protein
LVAVVAVEAIILAMAREAAVVENIDHLLMSASLLEQQLVIRLDQVDQEEILVAVE